MFGRNKLMERITELEKENSKLRRGGDYYLSKMSEFQINELLSAQYDKGYANAIKDAKDDYLDRFNKLSEVMLRIFESSFTNINTKDN